MENWPNSSRKRARLSDATLTLPLDMAPTERDATQTINLLNAISNNRPITPARKHAATKKSPAAPHSVRRTPLPRREPISANRNRHTALRGSPSTPHGRAALLELRYAANTPGGTRRRSGVQKRETPRDLLRQLSKALKRRSPPQQENLRDTIDEAGDDSDSDGAQSAPELTIPLNELEEDDSFDVDPPRLSMALEDLDNMTARSIELGRRQTGNRTMLRDSLTRQSLELDDALRKAQERRRDDTMHSEMSMQLQNDDETERLGVLDSPRDFMTPRRLTLGGDTPGSVSQLEEDTFVFKIPDVPRRRVDLELPRSPILDPTQINVEGAVSADNAAMQSQPQLDFQNDAPQFVFDEAVAQDDDDGIVWDEGLDPDVEAELELSELQTQAKSQPRAKRQPKPSRVSKHGHTYNPLPNSVVKRLATNAAHSLGMSKARLDKETVAALSQATDWFFEQVATDLAAFADHAGRVTIDESDVLTLMKRQRQIDGATTPFLLATQLLPRELLSSVRVLKPLRPARRRKKLEQIVEEEEEEEEEEATKEDENVEVSFEGEEEGTPME